MTKEKGKTARGAASDSVGGGEVKRTVGVLFERFNRSLEPLQHDKAHLKKAGKTTSASVRGEVKGVRWRREKKTRRRAEQSRQTDEARRKEDGSEVGKKKRGPRGAWGGEYAISWSHMERVTVWSSSEKVREKLQKRRCQGGETKKFEPGQKEGESTRDEFLGGGGVKEAFKLLVAEKKTGCRWSRHVRRGGPSLSDNR